MKSKLVLIIISLMFTNLSIAKSTLPKNYNSLTACEKQEALWSLSNETIHDDLPKFRKFGIAQLIGMTVQQLTKKKKLNSDIAPKRWKKYLHRRGVLAKVKVVPTTDSKYSGIFKGADCALLRLSITFKPTKKKKFAPGLALKVLRNNSPSANVSALYSLDGQGDDYNFFKNPLSNIIPLGDNLGLKLVHSLFRRVTDYPEELLVDDFAKIDVQGRKAKKVVSPRQVFFVPNDSLNFSSSKHDIRNDMLTIPAGTVLYTIHAASEKYQNYDYFNYTNEDISKFVKDSHPIGSIVSTSKFVASEFGDTGIFFRHEARPKK